METDQRHLPEGQSSLECGDRWSDACSVRSPDGSSTEGGLLAGRIESVQREATDAVAAASSTAELRRVRARFLGRKAELPSMLRSIGQLPFAERVAIGVAGNRLRRDLERIVASRLEALRDAELEEQMTRDRTDLTLPGVPPGRLGRMHLLTWTQREIEDIFVSLGFTVMEGPEVETAYYNFDALNHSSTHPARERSDTFYICDDVLLRTHTSPMQIRAMEQHLPPLFMISPGRTYRRDSDATHTPQFHQVEGLAVAENLTLADLKGTLLEFARQFFGSDREVRLRSHFFPFTEPSIEVDVSCFNCQNGGTKGGARCHVCKDERWLEILGAGMIDPAVLGAIRNSAYDPERIQGFVWGMGIERVAMLRHGLPSLRLFLDNDVRVLEQFG